MGTYKGKFDMDSDIVVAKLTKLRKAMKAYLGYPCDALITHSIQSTGVSEVRVQDIDQWIMFFQSESMHNVDLITSFNKLYKDVLRYNERNG